jgi:hypothetical protein
MAAGAADASDVMADVAMTDVAMTDVARATVATATVAKTRRTERATARRGAGRDLSSNACTTARKDARVATGMSLWIRIENSVCTAGRVARDAAVLRL